MPGFKQRNDDVEMEQRMADTGMIPASRHHAALQEDAAPRAGFLQDPIMILGWIATATAVLMYVSYIAQIQLNLAGHKGSIIQPLATVLNCSLWVAYGMVKPVRDWPLSLANAPGVLLGAITFATAL